MYTFQYSRDDKLYTVGYRSQSSEWVALKDVATEYEALQTIHYLNGGIAPELRGVIEAIDRVGTIIQDLRLDR